jgi:Tfp pilus assembly protein PilO
MNSNYKEFLKQNKLIIIPILVGVSSVIIIVFVIIPQVLGYFNVKTEIASSQSRLSILEAKAQDLNKLDEDETQQGLQVVSTLLPEDADIAGVIADIQGIASRSNLEVSHVGYLSTQSTGDKKNNFQIEVKLSGPIPNVRTFLLSLQSFPRVIQVDNIIVQSSTQAVESTISLTVFYSTDKSIASASLDQPITPLTDSQKKVLAQLAEAVKNKPTAPSAPRIQLPSPESSGSATPETLPLNVDTSSVPIGKIDPFN